MAGARSVDNDHHHCIVDLLPETLVAYGPHQNSSPSMTDYGPDRRCSGGVGAKKRRAGEDM